MDNIDYLKKKFKENKIKLRKPNDIVSETYFKNSIDELKASKIMIKQKLYSQSISHSYYSMYLVLQSLLFKIGVKCEDHNSSIIILKLVFNLNNDDIKKVKKERIEVQYYLKADINKDYSLIIMKKSEDFRININNFIDSLTNEKIINYNKKLKEMLEIEF